MPLALSSVALTAGTIGSGMVFVISCATWRVVPMTRVIATQLAKMVSEMVMRFLSIAEAAVVLVQLHVTRTAPKIGEVMVYARKVATIPSVDLTV